MNPSLPVPDKLNPIIEAAITLILARYAAVIPPEKLDDFRRSLRFGMETHPDAQALLRDLRPRKVHLASGTEPIHAMVDPDAPAATPSKKRDAR
jgi:hypothetical protein